MNEELIISGRNLPDIDPQMHIWHWPIYIDLFMGGLAAGLLFFAAYFTITGKENKMETSVKWASFLAPIAIAIALICLFIDLRNKLYFWRLYTTFKIESPMSFGSWVLLFITPLSFLWSFSYVRELFPTIDWKFKILKFLEKWTIDNRKKIAWALLFLSIGLGIYTGILLSAFNARPLWNTAIMGPLFLLYGLLTGSAVIVWMTKDIEEKRLFQKITLILIGVVVFFIVHLFLGYAAGSEVQLETVELFFGGEFTVQFWGIVVLLGLIFPAILFILLMKNYKLPVAVPAICILLGGLMFRMIIVDAGQMTRYLY